MTQLINVNDHTGFPPVFLNAYVLEELKKFKGVDGSPLMPIGPEPFQPFFPAQVPDSVEGIYNDIPFIRNNPDTTVIIFDRLMRFRPTPFYKHKREQLIYFIYSPNLSKLIDTTRVIIECLDREDAAAQDLNLWISQNDVLDENEEVIAKNVFFHNLKVYQADESRDIIELASARTLGLNKLVIEYDYHTVSVEGSNQRYS
jgi:hypothetical protein